MSNPTPVHPGSPSQHLPLPQSLPGFTDLETPDVFGGGPGQGMEPWKECLDQYDLCRDGLYNLQTGDWELGTGVEVNGGRVTRRVIGGN